MPEPRNTEAKAENAVSQGTPAEMLAKRKRELETIFAVTELVRKPDVTLPEVLQEAVSLIPKGLQHPDSAYARISVNGEVYTTENFKETVWKLRSNIKLSSDILAEGQRVGFVEVCYTDERPQLDDGPFYSEERRMLDVVTDRVGDFIERIRDEGELATRGHDLRERVKNLGVLHKISGLLADPKITVEEAVQKVVDAIPPGWQFANSAAAQIVLDGTPTRTRNYQPSDWVLSASISVYGKSAGTVDVNYLTEHPDADEGPFLDEEKALLESIAALMGEYLQRKQTEDKLAQLSYEMGERIKQLDCLYGISDLVETDGISEEEILEGVVKLLPAAWRFPDITCAKLILEDKVFVTDNFEDTPWDLTSDIAVDGKKIGTIEVYYLEERPQADEGPFVKEERGLLDNVAERVGEIIHRGRAEIARQEQAAELERVFQEIEQQNKVMMEMSTPVIQAWDNLILLPLIGVIDTARASQMIERMLDAVVESDARVAVLDVTGVPVIDTSVARHLLQTVDSAKILGCEVILTGIRPDAAQTLAQLGVDFSKMRTRGSLKAGIQEALGLIGMQISNVQENRELRKQLAAAKRELDAFKSAKAALAKEQEAKQKGKEKRNGEAAPGSKEQAAADRRRGGAVRQRA